jgi:hypothetical protein
MVTVAVPAPAVAETGYQDRGSPAGIIPLRITVLSFWIL